MRRNLGGCRHERTVATITAGLAHEVCESCGRVSIRFVADAVTSAPLVRAEPTTDRGQSPHGLPRRCRLCSQQAVFLIPDGMVCDEHAWQAAARIRWDESEPWVPIRIERTRA